MKCEAVEGEEEAETASRRQHHLHPKKQAAPGSHLCDAASPARWQRLQAVGIWQGGEDAVCSSPGISPQEGKAAGETLLHVSKTTAP